MRLLATERSIWASGARSEEEPTRVTIVCVRCLARGRFRAAEVSGISAWGSGEGLSLLF